MFVSSTHQKYPTQPLKLLKTNGSPPLGIFLAIYVASFSVEWSC